MLLNLVNNAIKFTPENGVVTVDAHKKESMPDMPVGVMDYVEISVSDTGIGISEEHKAHIFEKFYQVEDSLSRKERRGTGLGLAISKGLIEAHGGSIRFESIEGEGSTFIFTLPMIDMENKVYFTVENELSKAKRNHSPLSVLVLHIDDIESVKTVYREKMDNNKVMDLIKDKIVSFGIKTTDKIDIYRPSNEIVLIMPDTDRNGAEALLGRVNKNFSKDEAVIGKYSHFFTTSIATYPDDGTTEKELVDFARGNIKQEIEMHPDPGVAE